MSHHAARTGTRGALAAGIIAALITVGAGPVPAATAAGNGNGNGNGTASAQRPASASKTASQVQSLVSAARAQIGRTTLYDPAYVRLAYPGGDVPIERGVCTDVVIRAYRGIGVDLQVLVHQDMVRNFAAYPRTSLKRPDTNIDHRRVRNLAVFFRRAGAAVPVTSVGADYLPGDLVTWDVSGLAHIGLVADVVEPGTDRHLVVHNIGSGAQLEDILFAFPVTGHYRYRAA